MPLLRVPIGSDGPVVELVMWIGRSAAHSLVAQGRPVPSPQTIRALIDTGADRTAIHPNALALINSPPAGTVKVRRPSSMRSSRPVNLHGGTRGGTRGSDPNFGGTWGSGGDLRGQTLLSSFFARKN